MTMLGVRADGDDSTQATVDWSWGTVRYRLGGGNDDDDVDDVESPPQQPAPVHSTELQVRYSVPNNRCTKRNLCM